MREGPGHSSVHVLVMCHRPSPLSSVGLSRASPCGVQLLPHHHLHPLLRLRGERERDVINGEDTKVRGTSPYSVVAAVSRTCAQKNCVNSYPYQQEAECRQPPTHTTPYCLSKMNKPFSLKEDHDGKVSI